MQIFGFRLWHVFRVHDGWSWHEHVALAIAAVCCARNERVQVAGSPTHLALAAVLVRVHHRAAGQVIALAMNAPVAICGHVSSHLRAVGKVSHRFFNFEIVCADS